MQDVPAPERPMRNASNTTCFHIVNYDERRIGEYLADHLTQAGKGKFAGSIYEDHAEVDVARSGATNLGRIKYRLLYHLSAPRRIGRHVEQTNFPGAHDFRHAMSEVNHYPSLNHVMSDKEPHKPGHPAGSQTIRACCRLLTVQAYTGSADRPADASFDNPLNSTEL